MEKFEPEFNQPLIPEGRKNIRFRNKYKKKKKGGKIIRKMLEYLLWAVMVGAFITSLVILIKHLDISDKKVRDKRKKESTMVAPAYELPEIVFHKNFFYFC